MHDYKGRNGGTLAALPFPSLLRKGYDECGKAKMWLDVLFYCSLANDIGHIPLHQNFLIFPFSTPFISLAPSAARMNRLKALKTLYNLSRKRTRSHVDLMGVFTCSLNLSACSVFLDGAGGSGFTL